MVQKSHYVFGPGEGERYEARGSIMHFKAVARTTSGRLSLMERSLPAGGRMPPAHVHVDNDEAYFVLEGEVTFIIDQSEFTQAREAFVLVPGGTAHTFGNRGEEPARLLVIHAPALDGYFVELEDLWRHPVPPTLEQEQALMRRHGMRPA